MGGRILDHVTVMSANKSNGSRGSSGDVIYHSQPLSNCVFFALPSCRMGRPTVTSVRLTVFFYTTKIKHKIQALLRAGAAALLLLTTIMAQRRKVID